jgi:hypothetical protein
MRSKASHIVPLLTLLSAVAFRCCIVFAAVSVMVLGAHAQVVAPPTVKLPAPVIVPQIPGPTAGTAFAHMSGAQQGFFVGGQYAPVQDLSLSLPANGKFVVTVTTTVQVFGYPVQCVLTSLHNGVIAGSTTYVSGLGALTAAVNVPITVLGAVATATGGDTVTLTCVVGAAGSGQVQAYIGFGGVTAVAVSSLALS